jgi:hypothetical protein
VFRQVLETIWQNISSVIHFLENPQLMPDLRRQKPQPALLASCLETSLEQARSLMQALFFQAGRSPCTPPSSTGPGPDANDPAGQAPICG